MTGQVGPRWSEDVCHSTGREGPLNPHGSQINIKGAANDEKKGGGTITGLKNTCNRPVRLSCLRKNGATKPRTSKDMVVTTWRAKGGLPGKGKRPA